MKFFAYQQAIFQGSKWQYRHHWAFLKYLIHWGEVEDLVDGALLRLLDLHQNAVGVTHHPVVARLRSGQRGLDHLDSAGLKGSVYTQTGLHII